jgi:hypothetical protein
MPKRKSRAGQTQPSGLYVRANRPDGRGDKVGADLDAGAVTHATKAPVTLPALKFLERKKVAGEWL